MIKTIFGRLIDALSSANEGDLLAVFSALTVTIFILRTATVLTFRSRDRKKAGASDAVYSSIHTAELSFYAFALCVCITIATARALNVNESCYVVIPPMICLEMILFHAIGNAIEGISFIGKKKTVKREKPQKNQITPPTENEACLSDASNAIVHENISDEGQEIDRFDRVSTVSDIRSDTSSSKTDELIALAEKLRLISATRPEIEECLTRMQVEKQRLTVKNDKNKINREITKLLGLMRK